jgi:hypothetical protein
MSAAAAADLPPESYATLKRVAAARARVSRVFFVASRGVPLGALLPTFAKAVLLGPTGALSGARGATSPGALAVPVAAAPLSTVVSQIASTHDAAMGAAGVALSAAPRILELSRPEEAAGEGGGARAAELDAEALAPAALPPFVAVPFYAVGDAPTAVMPLRPTSSLPPVQPPFNSTELVVSGA